MSLITCKVLLCCNWYHRDQRYPRDSNRGEWSAIESHRAVAAAATAAVGRDDWVILKIVDGNDAGAIIKSRSMPRQSWRVISARVRRISV